ncbi:MAG TPA: hypothetical protein ENN97_03740 [Phycisphaerales bacterium]|nr:hypothetical protein [Phycisphaerales bacterium]
MTYRTGIGLLGLLATFMAGCGGSVRTETAADGLIVSDKAAALAAAEQTLRRMQFVIEKYDIEAGYIRTRPLRAGQFFEPWRQDNASAAAFARANLDSLRRTAEVFVEPDDGRMRLRCVIAVEKLSIPPRPIRRMAHLTNMYTDSTQRVQTLAVGREAAEQIEWIDIGPDEALQRYITAQIERRL